jgi:GNAT superfamily N-acetyltransferase
MDAPQAGHYWKTPFYWEPGCAEPPIKSPLTFEPVGEAWLRDAIGRVMAAGTDESDRYTVPRIGVPAAVQELYDLLPQYFERPEGWWKTARDAQTARGLSCRCSSRSSASGRRAPQGTIYMGVLPEHRGRGHALQLVHEATRVFNGAGCWRIFCDTGTQNLAMVQAFRQAGYMEREPWQRPLA